MGLGIHDYWLFLLTGVLLNLTPGQDTFYILGRSVAEGTRSGVASALGIGVGSLIHTAMAALGLSAILSTSATAFMVVKLLGAAYLVYIGVRMLRGANVPRPPASPVGNAGVVGSFRDGIVTNVLNPKVALFFLALLPQFIAPDSERKVAAFIALGSTFVTTGTIWCLVLAIAAGKLRAFFARHPKGWASLSRASGVLFVLLGLRLAMTRQ
jgi:threonine/homoserine/homoserine lactone efflux protein